MRRYLHGLGWGVLLLCLLGLLAPARAAAGAEDGAGPWTNTPEADVRFVMARQTLDAHGTISAGLEFRLKDGWKIYWRSPGDAGYPPSLTWNGSGNLAQAPVLSWPVPHRFEVLGIQTVGYKERVIFPFTVQATDPAQPLALQAEADYLICSTVCVPGHASVAVQVAPAPAPAQGEAPATTALAHDLEQFRARLPGDNRGLSLQSLRLEQDPSGTQSLMIEVAATPALGTEIDLFVEGTPEGEPAPMLVSAPASVTVSPDRSRATLRAPLANPLDPKGPLPSGLTLTVVDGNRGLEHRFDTPVPIPTATTPVAAAPLHAEETPVAAWATMIGLALLGGLILNVMPCVLPVLSLKVFALLGQGGAALPVARRSFLASAAGIVAAFLVLGGGLVALKAAGAAIGWGIQFQNPWFLAVMVVLITLFAANLWGLFEIRLPGMVNDAAAKERGDHLAGHFFTGVFATVLATPCSAPFLGTAVGFALARGAGEILTIFAALGVGMAAPYLLIALAPSWATRLPRPGRWMMTVKKGLALALFGTAVWLGVVLVSVVAPASQSSPASASAEAISWRPFSAQALAQAVSEGKVVFVDVTADWCITCKVNKAAVVDRDPVQGLLRAKDVVALQADWTRPDPAISAYLASFGRYGIPFNAVYGPKAPQGIALSELLTAQEVSDALAAARP